MDNLIIVGSGGHALASAEVIESLNKFNIVGLVDSKNTNNLNYPLLGDDEKLSGLRDQYDNAFIGVGQINDYTVRSNIYNKLKELNFKLPKILSPRSIYSNKSSIDEATIVMHGVIIGPKVQIGKNSIINSSSVLEHETIVGNNSHVSTNVTLNGNVKVGDGTFIGSGTIVKEGISIGSNCFIRMGSIINKNIANNEKV